MPFPARHKTQSSLFPVLETGWTQGKHIVWSQKLGAGEAGNKPQWKWGKHARPSLPCFLYSWEQTGLSSCSVQIRPSAGTTLAGSPGSRGEREGGREGGREVTKLLVAYRCTQLVIDRVHVSKENSRTFHNNAMLHVVLWISQYIFPPSSAHLSGRFRGQQFSVVTDRQLWGRHKWTMLISPPSLPLPSKRLASSEATSPLLLPEMTPELPS